MTKPLIGLLDCNNFFVSCERLFRPDLWEKPVVVLSSNDGCVVARSQEVKDMNVPMGVPYFKIKDTLQNNGVIVFSSHFALYRDISRRVISAMKEELSVVEQYSVDEAFFRVDGDPNGAARNLKCVVEQRVGVPVSVGVAATKTQAKCANELAKRGAGVAVLTPQEWHLRAPHIDLATVWGIGGKTALKCKAIGLYTVADLLAADPARIAKLFGVVGARLQLELSGTSALPLQATQPLQQSVTSSRSFEKPVSNKAVLTDAIAYHLRHAAADLRASGQVALAVRVLILPSRHGDFFLRGGSREAVLVAPTSDTFELLRVATGLLNELHEAGVPYKKAGVTLSRLQVAAGDTRPLFGNVPSRAPLLSIVDMLNTKAGREVVLLGDHLQAAAWRPRQGACSPAYTTKWKDIATVKAV